jgi:hypothetical protein
LKKKQHIFKFFKKQPEKKRFIEFNFFFLLLIILIRIVLGGTGLRVLFGGVLRGVITGGIGRICRGFVPLLFFFFFRVMTVRRGPRRIENREGIKRRVRNRNVSWGERLFNWTGHCYLGGNRMRSSRQILLGRGRGRVINRRMKKINSRGSFFFLKKRNRGSHPRARSRRTTRRRRNRTTALGASELLLEAIHFLVEASQLGVLLRVRRNEIVERLNVFFIEKLVSKKEKSVQWENVQRQS